MRVNVCIGSSCHIKGSRQVVERLRELIDKHSLTEKVELAGSFCMGQCQKGVCVEVDGEIHSVTAESAQMFFEKEILAKIS